MELLYFFESIRNPVLNFIFSLITELGGELVFIIVGMTMFWCVDKKQGYFVLIVGFFGVYDQSFRSKSGDFGAGSVSYAGGGGRAGFLGAKIATDSAVFN